MATTQPSAAFVPPLRPRQMLAWIVAFGVALVAGAVAMTALFSGPAGDRAVVPIGANACFAAFAEPRDAALVVADRNTFACDAGAVARVAGEQYWIRIDRARIKLDGPINLEIDSSPVEAWTIAHRSTDGRILSRQLTSREAYRHWTAGTRLSLPLSAQESAAAELFVGVERPWSRASVNAIELVSRDRAVQERIDRMIPFGIFAGVAIVPILYSMVLFFALGHRLMLFHALSALGLLTYTVASSSLLLFLLPETGPWTRTLTSYASLAIGVAFAAFFTGDFIERELVSDRMRRFMCTSGYVMLANALFIVTVGPFLPFLARNIYHMAYLVPILALVAIVATALRRGSTAAWFIVGGWFLTTLSALERILRGLDIYLLPPEADFSLYIGFAFEVVVTACGVALRVFSLRRERDLAKVEQRAAQRMAETDGLTGLANRRRFDRDSAAMPAGTLILVDVDHFKTINDMHGHQAGDDVLRALGALMARCEGPPWNATAYRVGGEEFALLLTTTRPAQAAAFAESLRALVERDLAAMVSGIERTLTVSIGVATCDAALEAAAYERADRALYESKQAGRNRVSLAGTVHWPGKSAAVSAIAAA